MKSLIKILVIYILFFSCTFYRNSNNNIKNGSDKYIKDGPFISYYNNGSIKEQGRIKNRLLDSLLVTYYEHSINVPQNILIKNFIKSKEYYKNGYKHGLCIYYYQGGGRKKSEGFYKNGIKDSVWIIYSENGFKKNVETIKNGERNGRWILYHDDSHIIKEEGYYKDTYKDRYWSWYSRLGNVMIEGEFFNRKKNGKWIEYYPNNNIKSLESWLEGKKNGLFEKRDIQGNKLTELVYIDEKKWNGFIIHYYEYDYFIKGKREDYKKYIYIDGEETIELIKEPF